MEKQKHSQEKIPPQVKKSQQILNLEIILE